METEAWLRALEARLGARVRDEAPRSPRALTVLYDPGCALCRRCRAWMEGQETYVDLRFVPATSDEAKARWGDLPWLGDELVVVGDGGEVWIGPAAFLTCLWALVAWRPWAYRLSAPSLAGLAERFFHTLSSHRRGLARYLDHDCGDGSCSIDRQRGRR